MPRRRSLAGRALGSARKRITFEHLVTSYPGCPSTKRILSVMSKRVPEKGVEAGVKNGTQPVVHRLPTLVRAVAAWVAQLLTWTTLAQKRIVQQVLREGKKRAFPAEREPRAPQRSPNGREEGEMGFGLFLAASTGGSPAT